MDPLLSPEMDQEADADARRKIQFSVPSPLATQLDPRQVEMVSAEGSNHKTNLFWINTNPPAEFVHFWHTRESQPVVTGRQLYKESVTTLEFGVFSCWGFLGGGSVDG